jgi:hypothetical protein
MSSGRAQPAADAAAAHTFPAMQLSISAVAPDFTSLRIEPHTLIGSAPQRFAIYGTTTMY